MEDKDTDPSPIEETDPQKRTVILTMVAVIGIGLCALFLIAFLWFQPDETSLFAKYFPFPTPTLRPTGTPAPTLTLPPDLTATQLAWVRPDESPTLGSTDEAENALTSSVSYIEYHAVIYPDTPEINQPGDVYIFEVRFDHSEPLLWSYGWCATTQEILEENFSHMRLAFTINETPASLNAFTIHEETQTDSSHCRNYVAVVEHWPPGVHHLDVQITFTQPTDDGWNVYPAGTHSFNYIVTVEN